jgi:hypothetical protein
LVVDRDYFDFLISKLVKASQSRHLELLWSISAIFLTHKIHISLALLHFEMKYRKQSQRGCWTRRSLKIWTSGIDGKSSFLCSIKDVPKVIKKYIEKTTLTIQGCKSFQKLHRQLLISFTQNIEVNTLQTPQLKAQTSIRSH